MRMGSIRSLLVLAATLVAVFLVLVIYIVVARIYDKTAREDAERVSELLAQQTFNSMYQVMSRGWSRQEVEQFMARNATGLGDSRYRLQVFRGPVVEEKFGAIGQPQLDEALHRVLREGTPIEQSDGDGLRYLYPLKVKSECLRCHTNAGQGQVLGVIEVRQNLRPLLDKARERFMSVLVWILPIPPLVALLVAVWIGRMVERSTGMMAADIQAVNRVSDLTILSSRQARIGLRELDQVLVEVDKLILRLREVAVDKDLLEFEIQLLEGFVLTSEVIRDWRENVSQLLVEINRYIPAYSLFSVFRGQGERINLEVFWHTTPSEASRRLMEQNIIEVLETSEVVHGSEIQRIEHHVATHTNEFLEVDPGQLSVQCKSLLLENPKIGGIVGIGVHASIDEDSTHYLVIEGILTTLLNVVGSVKAISRYTQDLEYYATRDPLTNLYNQRVFWELLGYEVCRVQRHGHSFAILIIDLDDFKSINDNYGHSVGDRFLQMLADLFSRELRQGDILARYGGDEFVALLPEIEDDLPERAAERIRARVEAFTMDTGEGAQVSCTVSIGIAIFPEHADNEKDLFMFADNMMYRAKGEGKNRLVLPNDSAVLANLQDIAAKGAWVRKIIDEGRVEAWFQPIARSLDGKICAFEVLARIPAREQGMMYASQFIDIVERQGLIRRMDTQVMDKAFTCAAEIGYQGLLFVNLSPKALVLAEFFEDIEQLIDRHQIDPRQIVFELTERETVKNISVLERFVRRLTMQGYRFAIDDFGSGFSSFHYIRRFPVDFIKIEGEFVAGMPNTSRDAALVRSISGLAADLGIRTIAEFVESEEVMAEVRKTGIDLVQGYHLGRPSPRLWKVASECAIKDVTEPS